MNVRRVASNLLLIVFLSLWIDPAAAKLDQLSPAETVRDVLSAPENELGCEQSKLTFDRIMVPEVDEGAVTAEVDQLAADVTP